MNNNNSSSERNCSSTVTNPHRNQTRFWVMGHFNLLHVSRCVRPFRPIDWFRKEVWPIACKLATRDQIYRAEPRGGKQNCRLEVYGKMCILSSLPMSISYWFWYTCNYFSSEMHVMPVNCYSCILPLYSLKSIISPLFCD